MSQLPNQRCACDSGKKFKKCCMTKGFSNSPPPPETPEERTVRRQEAREGQRVMNEMTAMLGVLAGAHADAMNARRADEMALEELRALVEKQVAGKSDTDIVVIG